RNVELLQVQNEISEEDNAEFIGRNVEVLVEGPSKKGRATSELPAQEPLPGWHGGPEPVNYPQAQPAADDLVTLGTISAQANSGSGSISSSGAHQPRMGRREPGTSVTGETVP